MRMPASPLEIAASIAWIWVSSSPSSLPADSVRFTPLAAAAVWAPSCMAMKNGFELVFTMSETPMSPSPPPPIPWVPLAQPVRPSTATASIDDAARSGVRPKIL